MQKKRSTLPAEVKRTIDDPTRCSTCGGKLELPAVDMGSDLCFSCQTKSIPEAAEWLKLQAQHPLKNTMEMDELLRKMRHPSRSAKLRAFMEGVDRSGVFRELPTEEFQELSPDEFRAQQVKQTEPLYRLDERGNYNEINPDEVWKLVPPVPPIHYGAPKQLEAEPKVAILASENVTAVTQFLSKIAAKFPSGHRQAIALALASDSKLSDEEIFSRLDDLKITPPKGTPIGSSITEAAVGNLTTW